MSPVCSQPSASMTLAVSSGRLPVAAHDLRALDAQLADFAHAATMLPSSSLRQASVDGTGRPIAPLYSARSIGLMHAAGEVSVRP